MALLVRIDIAAKELDFNRDIRPILSNNCFACHGPDSAAREADLRLDREENAKAIRHGHPAVVSGNLDESELVTRITTTDADERMPPVGTGKKLKPEEVALLKQWIAGGADWSLAWSYVPPVKPRLPKVRDDSWPYNVIDYFVLARLESEHVKPSRDADKRTLVRRLFIDLIGLPPTLQEVDDYLLDTRADAYDRLVDRLLASPHYGERMAMYWLDLVRYADTVGYHGDQEQHISPYRDYVINALNANMPFDQFTREQLAGDLLSEPTIEQKIATGYNRVLQTSHEGGVQPKEYLAIYAADHVRNLSAVWMGATLGCAQCHDHKYDPFTTHDFYSMAAFFADIDEARHLTHGVDTSPTIRLPELELLSAAEQDTLSDMTLQKNQFAKQIEQAKSQDNEVDVKKLNEQIETYTAKINNVHKRAQRTMITQAIEPRMTRILPRGNWMDDSGDIVAPAIPAFLGTLETSSRRATRLDLANWLVDPRRGGGLTSRVMVNRFWYLLFGRGIAANLDDFGGQGEAPDNPELLDHLAIEFVNNGWDIKHMLKLIVSSRAYQQQSTETTELHDKDPLNRLVARQASYRYSAESIRDAVLVISGLLVPAIGGPSVHPYQPAGYYRHLNYPAREYVADTNDSQWRRGVYMHWQRQYLHPMLKAFDAPTREECTVQRARSNTSPAALVLLNDPTFVEAARTFATRILLHGGSTADERIDYAFRQAVSRDADSEEHAALEQLLAQDFEYYHAHREAADKLLGIGLKRVPASLDKVELASWTLVVRTVLNLSEVFTRN
jgi:Protein of unknown function (DUF1553)/Protein of unknown function (DUF1549)/Planctomycete cytochrome C